MSDAARCWTDEELRAKLQAEAETLARSSAAQRAERAERFIRKLLERDLLDGIMADEAIALVRQAEE